MEKKNHLERKIGLYGAAFVGLLLLLCILFWASISTGSVDSAAGDVLLSLVRGERESEIGKVLWFIRLPRALGALLVGGALSVSGYLLQSFFRNPIAGPFVLGISSGAKLFVALCMIFVLQAGFFASSLLLVGAAFIGAACSVGVILPIFAKISRMSVLIICGVMIGYVCSAVTDFLVTFADDADIVNLHNWSRGSLAGITMGQVGILGIVVLLSCGLSFLLSKPISVYRMGDAYAGSVGVSLKGLRMALILLSSLLAAAVTAFVGPISFVGVAVPHLIRCLFKNDSPYVMIPGCFLGGAGFVLACDLISRVLFSPTELSVSSVTALLGAPVVMYLMLRRGK